MADRDELTMDRAARRLVAVTHALAELLANWDKAGPDERRAAVESAVEELADLGTMALGYRFLAEINGVELPDEGGDDG